MDKIIIDGLELFAYHGVNEDEKRDGQRFLIDAELLVDITRPCQTDRVEDTVSYSAVAKTIRRVFTAQSYDLLERAAEVTAGAVLEEHPAVRSLTLTLKKPEAPMKAKFQWVGVTIQRGRTSPADSGKRQEAYIALGSNLGDRLATLSAAVKALSLLPHTAVTAVSRVYLTEPVGYDDQPDFYNAAVRLETGLTPRALLGACLGIEAALGRHRQIKNGPRTVDLDVLLHGTKAYQDEELTLPHPRMLERVFVLAPLCDVCGNALYHDALKQVTMQGVQPTKFTLTLP